MRARPEGSPERVPAPPSDVYRDAPALADLFVSIFRRDVQAFFPETSVEPVCLGLSALPRSAPSFRLFETPEAPGEVEAQIFGSRYRIASRGGSPLTPLDLRMIRAIGSVLSMRYYHLFQVSNLTRLELFRGGSEDHYVAAFVEPEIYAPPGSHPSRIAATVQTLRTAALSTYENHRVSTGALLLGAGDDSAQPIRPTAPDALTYGVELTALKSVHRLCDGHRTLFLVDRAGKLADIIDIGRWAGEVAGSESESVPCIRLYQPHARATRVGGNLCMVLSPNQEIKLFAEGVQAFAFAHGRWRILDPEAKFATWSRAVAHGRLARVLFEAALNMAEARTGGLFVVLDDPESATGRLVARHDLIGDEPRDGPPAELAPRDPLARRALHYLARNRSATEIDASVLESLASLDGALVTDRSGRLIAFGAILRQDDAADLPGLTYAEGARTTAALAASLYGPVLKVSEDGFVSCFLAGQRVWDL